MFLAISFHFFFFFFGSYPHRCCCLLYVIPAFISDSQSSCYYLISDGWVSITCLEDSPFMKCKWYVVREYYLRESNTRIYSMYVSYPQASSTVKGHSMQKIYQFCNACRSLLSVKILNCRPLDGESVNKEENILTLMTTVIIGLFGLGVWNAPIQKMPRPFQALSNRVISG